MTLTTAQIVLIIPTVLVMLLVALLYRQKRIGALSFFLWFPLWIAITVVILFPNTTVVLAGLLGIGRGADLVLYLSILLLLYLVFRVIIRLERMDKDITTIVRSLALKDEGRAENLHHKKSK